MRPRKEDEIDNPQEKKHEQTIALKMAAKIFYHDALPSNCKSLTRRLYRNSIKKEMHHGKFPLRHL